nr:Flp pilus assembly protein TadD, contains TPR repeats [Klebsiella pneumoniae]
MLRHNKDLPQAEQTLRSLLNDDPQNAAARENLYYVLREQNKSAEAQAMLQTLPQSLRQNCSRGWWPVCRAMPCAVRPRRRSAAVTQPAPLPLCAKASPAIRTIPAAPRPGPAAAKSGNGSEASSLMSAAYRPGASNSALYAAALFASENGAGSRRRRCWRAFPAAARPATCAICASG